MRDKLILINVSAISEHVHLIIVQPMMTSNNVVIFGRVLVMIQLYKCLYLLKFCTSFLLRQNLWCLVQWIVQNRLTFFTNFFRNVGSGTGRKPWTRPPNSAISPWQRLAHLTPRITSFASSRLNGWALFTKLKTIRGKSEKSIKVMRSTNPGKPKCRHSAIQSHI